MITVAGLAKIAAQQYRAAAAIVHSTTARYNWPAVARPEQILPGEPGAAIPRKDWQIFMVKSGRGWGKTLTGAQAVRAQVAEGRRRSVALVAPTLGDGRRLMLYGPSGIMTISPPAECPRWIEKERELVWPNGAMGYLYSSEEPERLRGGNHDMAWCEELGAWRNASMTWRMLRLANRITGPRGDHPQYVITTTPRPTDLIRELVVNPLTIVQEGTTYDNAANLDPLWLAAIREEFEGTRLGEQEIEGKLLGDTPGALWKMAKIEAARVVTAPDFLRSIIAVDPATADVEERRKAAEAELFIAETGIIAAGRAACRCRGQEEQHAFITDDLSGYFTPEEWGTLVVEAFNRNQADHVIAEVNQGGELVAANIRAQGGQRIPIRTVHASRGKATRAEPIASLAEKGLVHHVGVFPKLEDQLTTWSPLTSRKSPDRLDAYVWGLTDLMLGIGARPFQAATTFRPRVVPRRI